MKNKSELFSANMFWDCVCENRIYIEEPNGDAYAAEIENYTCHSVTIRNIATNNTKTYLYDDYGKEWRAWASRPSMREMSTYQWSGKKNN